MAYQRWMGLDPGTANFGVSIIRYGPKKQSVKPLYAGLLEQPIKNLTATPVGDKVRRGKPTIKRDEPSFPIGMQLFVDEIDYLITKYRVTHIAIERFQTRGGSSMGDTIECVSAMLGIICYIAHTRGIKFVTTVAGVWKGAVNRNGGDLQAVYDYGKINHDIAPHIIDATMIALCHANKEIPWANNALQLIKWIANVSIQRDGKQS